MFNVKRLSLFIFIALSGFLIFNQSSSIYGGDAGDLVTAAFARGVAHPPGYPLYTLVGYFLTLLPFSSVAWRVTLLSSISMAGFITITFYLSYRLTKSMFNAWITLFTLLGSYLTLLYASVPEVFGLFLLFIALLYVFGLTWINTGDKKYLYAWIFTFSLSLTHHHLILFTLPSFIYLGFLGRKKLLKSSKKDILQYAGLFLIGLLPYIYVYFAAKGNPPINWENPDNLKGFLRLVTRATYGSFTAATDILQSPQARLTVLLAYWKTLVDSFTMLGMLIAIAGSLYQWKIQRKVWTALMLGWLSIGPIYMLYAAYIISNTFTIATFERFVMPSFFFVGIWLTFGLVLISKTLIKGISKITSKPINTIQSQYGVVLGVVFLIIPLTLFKINFPDVNALKNDRTAEKHAFNYLDTPPKNAILILANDNVVFNAEYAYFVLGHRSDIMLIHEVQLFGLRTFDFYKEHYPDLKLPDITSKNLTTDFMNLNYDTHPIYTNIDEVDVGGYVWVKEGLLFRLYKPEEVPPIDKILEKNDSVWKTYYNPLSDSLKTHKNLMLASILMFYRDSAMEIGDIHMVAGNFEKALDYYSQAIEFDPYQYKQYERLSRAQSELGMCKKALASIDTAIELRYPFSPSKQYITKATIYEQCLKDSDTAKKMREKAIQIESDKSQSLEEL